MPVLASIAMYHRRERPLVAAQKEMAVQAEPPAEPPVAVAVEEPAASEDGSPMPVAEHRFVAVEPEAVVPPALQELKELFVAWRRCLELEIRLRKTRCILESGCGLVVC